jgi:hypothetical protein
MFLDPIRQIWPIPSMIRNTALIRTMIFFKINECVYCVHAYCNELATRIVTLMLRWPVQCMHPIAAIHAANLQFR